MRVAHHYGAPWSADVSLVSQYTRSPLIFRSKITKTLTFLRRNSLFKPTLLLCTFLVGTFSASLVHGAANTFLNTLKSAFVRTNPFVRAPFGEQATKGVLQSVFARCMCINSRSQERFLLFRVSALSFSCHNSCSFSINKLGSDDYPEIGA